MTVYGKKGVRPTSDQISPRKSSTSYRNREIRCTKASEHLRICSLCQASEVENECHVTFSCTLCDTLRNKFFMKSLTNITFFNDLDVKSKILFLFNKIDPFIRKSVAPFIFEIINCRHNHVISKVT